MPISLSQLNALAALRTSGSFTAAAERLGMTQPAVTQHLASLARTLDVRLVDVIGRRAVLTQAGEHIASRAESIVAAVAALRLEAAEFADARAGQLEIGATVTIGTYVLPALLAAFHRGFPGISVRVRVANTAVIAGLVREQQLALALVEGIPGADLVAVPFMRDELLCIVSCECDPVNGAQHVDLTQLAQLPFVSREPGSGTRDLGYEAIVRAGVEPRIVLELPSGEAILRAVEAGLGIAILSRLVVERAIEQGTVRAVRVLGVDMQRALTIVRSRERSLSPAQRHFAQSVLATDEGKTAFEAGDMVHDPG